MADPVRGEWLCEPLPRDVRAALARLERQPDVRRVAVMPDVHLARDVCIGTVVATGDTIYPEAVGGDIGCGMVTVRLRGPAARAPTEREGERLFDALHRHLPPVRRAQPSSLPDVVDRLSPPLRTSRLVRDLAVEFGTVGRGNHFVELQVDDEQALWLLVHSGSRALGPAVRRHWTSGEAANRLVGLPSGTGYLADHDAAVAFARANRARCLQAAIDAFVEVLGDVEIDEATRTDVVHNFVRRERHGDEDLWVHRKGAASAREGEPGIIPGSMGTETVHVTGRGHEPALTSSSHGAGRCLARGEAMRRISRQRLERELRSVLYEHRLAERLRDEAPGAYKDLGKVLRAQRDLVRIVRRLRPLLAYKAA